MTALVYRRHLISTDPRLKRHVNHDSRSRAYAFPTEGLTLTSTKHDHFIEVLDQGQIGSCTGNAGIGCLGTGLFFANRGTHYNLDQAGALALYSEATRHDPFAGEYPPTDTGSDGLTIAKVLKSHNEIAGYQHTFSLVDALKALTVTPFITGTNWYESMFYPDTTGKVTLGGYVAGGHEYLADEIDVERNRIWFTNSWGDGWGNNGRFWMSFTDFGTLLGQQGDVTIFVPITKPAPEPTPPQPCVDEADRDLARKVKGWANSWYRLTGAKARRALRIWLKAKGF